MICIDYQRSPNDTIRYENCENTILEKKSEGIIQNMNCCIDLNCNNKEIWYMYNDECDR